MKASELRDMTVDELNKELDEKIEALFNLRFQKAKRILENVNAIRLVKRDIARMKTLLREKEKGDR